MTMPGNVQPLEQRFPIVKPDGTPTEYFIRWAQQKQIDIKAGITAEQALQIVLQFTEDHPLIAGSGIAFAPPSGDIADDLTISADVQAILNQISTTQGSILYRGAATWAVLAPGTAGFVLSTNGAGADPAWVAQSGGGGAACPAIRASAIQKNASAGSHTLAFPAGTAAGDYAVIFYGGGFGDANITLPATALWNTYQQAATNWGGTIFTKLLTAADITAGQVTITPSGTFDSVSAIVIFTGAAQVRNEILQTAPRTKAIQAPGTAATSSTQASIYKSADDCVLIFASNRANSVNTSNYGTLRNTVSAANGSAAIYAEEAPAAGGNTVTLSYTVAGTGRFELILIVRGPV